MERKSFVFHAEWLNQLNELPEDSQKHYALAIIKYALEAKEPEFTSPFEKIWFSTIRQRIDADKEKYQEQCERNRRNGSKSKGNPNFEKGKTNPYTTKEVTHSVTNDNPLGYKDNPLAKKDNPKAYDIDIDNDIDTDTDIVVDTDTEPRQTNNKNKEIPSLSQIQEYIKTHCYASDPNSFYELNKKYNWAKVRKGEASWQELLDKFEDNLPEEERAKADRERKQMEEYHAEYNRILAMIEKYGLEDVMTIDFDRYIFVRKYNDHGDNLRFFLKRLNVFQGVHFTKKYDIIHLCNRDADEFMISIKKERFMLDQEIKGRGLTADLGKFIGTDEKLLNLMMYNRQSDGRGVEVEYIGELSERIAEHHNLADLDLYQYSELYMQELRKFYKEVREDKSLSLWRFSVIDIMEFIKETEELSDYVPDFEIAYNTRNYLKTVFAKDPKIFKDEAKWKKLIIDFVKG